MPPYHLYLLQCSFHRIPSTLQELSQILATTDHIVLMEDAIFSLQDPHIAHFSSIYILGNADHLIKQDTVLATQQIKLIGYDELADLIAHAEKVHSWR